MRVVRHACAIAVSLIGSFLLVAATPHAARAQSCSASSGSSTTDVSPCDPSTTVSAGQTGLTQDFTVTATPTPFLPMPLTSISCTPSGVVTSCSVSNSSTVLLEGYAVVTVTYAVSSSGGTGSVQLSGTTSDGTVTSSLSVTATVPQTYTVSVTPDGQAVSVDRFTNQSASFTVHNSGNTGTTYSVSTNCSGTVSNCGAPSTVTVGAGQDASVTLTYSVGDAATTGTAGIGVSGPSNADGGSYAVTVNHFYGASVSGGSPNAPPATTLSTTFSVTNNSDQSLPFTFSIACSGAASSCSTPSGQTIGAGAMAQVTVNYTTGSTVGAGGTVSLTANYSSLISSAGSASVSVTGSQCSTTTTTVSTCDPNVTVDAGLAGATHTMTFTVSPVPPLPTGITGLHCVVSGIVTGCNVPSSIGVVEGSGSLTVTYDVSSSLGTGTVTVVGTADDGLLWNTMHLTSVTRTVTVTPDGTAISVDRSTNQTATFDVHNGGNSDAQYAITTNCSGSGVTGCQVSPSPLSVPSGETRQATLSYTAGLGGTTGTAGITATAGSFTDGGSYTVTVNHFYGATATPVVSSVAVPVSETRTAAFTVTNTSDQQLAFTFTTSCPGSAFASCPAPPGVTLAANGGQTTVNVTYTTGTTPTSGTLSLTATSGAAIGTGSMTVSVPSDQCSTTTATLSTCGPSQTVTAGTSGNTYTVNVTVSPTPPLPTALSNVHCTASGAVASCNVPSSVVISEGSGQILITYAVSSTVGTGAITVVGTADDGTVWTTLNVTTTPPPTYTVVVTPDGQGVSVDHNTTPTATFKVKNTGNHEGIYSVAVNCSGTVISCSASSPITIAAGDSTTVTLGYTVGGPGTTGTAGITVTSTLSSDSDGGSYAVTVNHVFGVAVAAVNGTLSAPASDTRRATFNVTNSSDQALTFTLTTSCTGSAFTSCSAQPDILINSGATVPVSVTYHTSATVGASASLSLTATYNSTTATASSTVTLTAALSPAAPGVDVLTANPGETVARDLCLTVAAGKDAAYECGDLRLAHALPTVRTKNKARTPVLLYNSQHAAPFPIVAANVTIPSTSKLPDSVTAVLSVNGTNPASSTWGQSSWTAGETHRVALGFDASSYATDAYPYTLQVTAHFGATTQSSSATGTLIVVNRHDSPFGAGWWLAGLERITPLANGDLLWVGGDGSARVYHTVTSSAVWAAASVDRPDTVKASGGVYTRYAEHGVRVEFNGTGQHVRTINRLADTTTFAYGASGLSSITVPPAAASASYAFTYGNTNAKLSQVTLTAGSATRSVTVANPAGALVTSITDPDTLPIAFTYVGSTTRIATRTDKSGHATTYSYDAGGKLTQVSMAMASPTPAIVTNYRAQEILGLAGAEAADSAGLYTLVNGPRADTTVSKFYLDRFGEPRKIVNALGDSTVMARTDSRFPALVTSLRRPNGFTTTATYDARGNASQSTDVNPFGTSVDATTAYTWDGTFDFATSITPPAGPATTFHYDASGNRDWQQPGSDAARRVTFDYYASGVARGLLRATQTPLGSRDSVEYDAVGNLSTTRTPLGTLTHVYHDAFGRDTLTMTPIDSAQAVWRQDSTKYDLMDRPIRAVSYGPSYNGQVAQRAIIITQYDNEGNATQVQRSAIPDTAGVGTLTTSATYDYANRKVTDVAVDGKVETSTYDPAGNVTQVLTRRNHTITMKYDALNRLGQKTVPEIVYPAESGFFNGDYPTFPRYPNNVADGYTIPQNVSTFAYDVNGNVIRADNGDALIRRSYTSNGTLKTDTLVIRNYTVAGGGGDTTAHRYGLQYDYDIAGRRTTITHPSTLTGSGLGLGTTSYEYEAATGFLSVVNSPVSGISYRQTYDLDGHRDSLVSPGGIAEKRTYDLDGRMTARVIRNKPFQSGHDFFGSTLRDEVLTYDVRGKVLTARNGSINEFALTDSVTNTYGTLGELRITHSHSRFKDAMYGTIIEATHEQFTLDALGNQRYATYDDSTFVVEAWDGRTNTQTNRATTYHYTPGTGRLATDAWDPFPTSPIDDFVYDSAGNLRRQQHNVAINEEGTTFSFYSADGQLRAVDQRNGGSSFLRTFEEYRYDALGRRVLVRSRVLCDPFRLLNQGWDTACHSKIRRTVWDGSQELWEIQGPGDEGMLPSALEDDSVGATPGGFRIENSLWGRVVYTHGLDVDQPWGVARIGFSTPEMSGQYPLPYTLHYDWRGSPTVATVFNGLWWWCPGTPGDACMITLLPGQLTAYQQQRYVWNQWTGSLVEKRTDGTGQQYLRNRYYDPSTGRFTQEDPLGLAGGLNSYGFAGGDPVNFSDPFGLCPPGAKDGTFCLDLFIQAKTAMGLQGDNRDFDPDAPASSSRAQILIDPADGTETHTISKSCIGSICRQPLGPNKNKVSFSKGTLNFNLTNSVMFGLGPDIDGTVSFSADGKGGWMTHGNMTAFPSSVLYRRMNGKWVNATPNHTETTPFDLIDGRGRMRW